MPGGAKHLGVTGVCFTIHPGQLRVHTSKMELRKRQTYQNTAKNMCTICILELDGERQINDNEILQQRYICSGCPLQLWLGELDVGGDSICLWKGGS